MKTDYFKVFTNCIIAKGITRSLLCDIQRQNSVFVPNSLVEIIERLNKKEKISILFKEYGEDNQDVLQEYFEYLVQEDYGFYCGKKEFHNFPKLDQKFINPSQISNFVIELRINEINSLIKIVPHLEKLGCKDVALVFYEKLKKEDYYSIKDCFDGSIIKSVEIISNYEKEFLDFVNTISVEFKRLTSLFYFNSPYKKKMDWNNKILCDIWFITENYKNFNFCGVVTMEYFNTNLPKVLEAINHNSCLHKKIAIDIDGNIRNCPSMPQSFGNIKDTTLEEALNHKDFKKYWNITKDQIDICKDCEFRYICTDCRAYTERTHTNEEGLDTSKPLKCGYDPYTGEWQEWSTNPLKEKAINFYGMQDLVKK